jgi:predicted dehydrogenase
MKIAFIGCGYVADFYMVTLPTHPELELVGVYDRDPERLRAFAAYHGTKAFSSLDALLADLSIEMVLNLTNPREHFNVTRACLERGKHVYSEKPLGMTLAEAQELSRLAAENGRYLSSAPCSVLGECAQTLWAALRENKLGAVRLVLANFDDGMIAPKMAPWSWRSSSGAPWPAQDEFEVGCTYEHAGYFLTWLAAFFGPARRVTSFASLQLPDKGLAVDKAAPDFTSACIEYDGGVVARVGCSLIAPHDKSLTVVCDQGTLQVQHLRQDDARVLMRQEPPSNRVRGLERRLNKGLQWLEHHAPWIPWQWQEWKFKKVLPLVRTPSPLLPRGMKRVDFCRGPVELARAVRESRPCRLSAELGVHIVEILEALQSPTPGSPARTLHTTFPPITPLTD